MAKGILPADRFGSPLDVSHPALLHVKGPLSGPAGESAGGLVKRHWVVAMVLLVCLAVGSIFAQELGLLGRYDDARYIKQSTEDTNQIVFARLIYNGRIPGYYKNWYTDYPDAEHHLISGLKRLTNLNISDHERAVAINDPDLFRYPFVYTSEPEQMVLTEDDAAIMREYLDRGGFWILDDFWGTFEWQAMERQLRKIIPNVEFKDIPRDHTIFHQFYDIDKIIQVPSLAYAYNGGITWEQDGFVAECKGVWDDNGRLMIVINHNTDLGDAYEHADNPLYPHYFSGFAYRVAINFIMYSLTH